MKNGPIEEAIEKFRNRRRDVYEADPDQIVRDTRAADRATKDHVGRWLFELLQNSDDAGASEVRIIIEKDTIYVADNGHGLKPAAVSAICGTDFSDKTTGTIGRKGVGFKSVYEVSRNPQVLTVDGEGIEFSSEKTKAWLSKNHLNDGHVPHQWIPFFISWDDAQRQDPQLSALSAYRTVIRLPGLTSEKKVKVEQLLKEWPPHALFAFRHVRKITAPGLELILSPGENAWSLRDRREQTPVEWRVFKHTERPPANLLEVLGADERQAVSTDGVSFLIAAPLQNGCVVPTTEYLPIHVFYPTEQIGPVRLLLHAEFLVKSDRTAIMPIDGNPFNAWVADRLTYHFCRFVNHSFHPESPSSHAALLVPFADRTSHPVAENLWRRIADEAKKCLRLADVEGCQRLSLEKARLISVSVRPDLARTLLEATSLREQLLHPAFDDDEKAREALRELGCKEIDDNALMTAIAENAGSLAAETQWVYACWEWLSAWVAKEPYGEEHETRIEQVRSLPIVPIGGSVVRVSDLAGRIVTWKPDTGVGNLPDWLPLTFVEDWFRDRIKNEAEKKSPVWKLTEELGIDKPGADVIQRAVGLAIEQYWKDRHGDPGRFLRFILEQDWYERAEAPAALKRCPVPLAQPLHGEAWAKASESYFGREWGNDVLADLYDGITEVPWVANDDKSKDSDSRQRVLEWLGAANCPRIVEESQKISVWNLPQDCEQWRRYLGQERDDEGRRVERITTVSRMDNFDIENLDTDRSVLIICLLAKHWEAYYRNRAEVTAEGTLGRERYYRRWQVKAKWWWEILERVPLPKRGDGKEHIALKKIWLPDKPTERLIGDLLPVVDVDAFGIDKDAVRDWLITTVGLRTRIEQLTIEEWKTLLSRHIPEKAPAERLASKERLRDKVTGWYTACLETVAEQENVSEGTFASCPLLCRKGDEWQYIADEPRYLNDDNDSATAFAKDVWLFHIPARLAAEAVKYFGVQPLSQSVKVNVTPGKPEASLEGALSARFQKSLPYVWAWRSSQSKEAAEWSHARLKGMEVRVVPSLKKSLSLGKINREIERSWDVVNNIIYLHEDHANEPELAQALAKLLKAPSEADLYENLLRCTDDSQRKQKLLNKGIADDEIDRCLRDYLEPPPDDKYDEDRVVDKPPSGGAGAGGNGRGGKTERERHYLTDAEKSKLEEAGRDRAARKLEKMGYSVEKMPQDNPGYDLRAKKDGEELRVEVKAHSGRATVVDITQREYKEYLGQQGYRWELWNVEHLAEDDPDQVVITRYDQIPDDALDVRAFWVDLKKCPKMQD